MPTKICLVKAMVFPVVMYGCESWTIKKAEHWTTDAFELWCWRRLLSPLNCKEIQPVHPKGDQSWVFIGRTAVEAETLIFWPPDVKNQLIRKDPDAGKDWWQKRRGWKGIRWLDGIADSIVISLSKLWEMWRTGKPGMLHAVHGVAKTWFSNWTTTMKEGHELGWKEWIEKRMSEKYCTVEINREKM